MNIEVADPGHEYWLPILDGKGAQWLSFVKRIGDKFPGNEGMAHPGVTLQFVLRALCERMRYLNGQVPCLRNQLVLFCLRAAIWLLEQRAAIRHGRSYWHGLDFAEKSDMCPICGHTDPRQHDHVYDAVLPHS